MTYIAGPMTGHEDHNFPAFQKAADWLRSQGFPVHSPHESGADPAEEYATCLKRALHLLLQCKQIVMLPGWHKSTGAKTELTIARTLGMPIKYLIGDDVNVGYWLGDQEAPNGHRSDI